MSKYKFRGQILNKIFCHKNFKHYDHCIKVSIASKEIFFCSRCLGLYPFAIFFLIISVKYNFRLSYPLEKKLIFYTLLPLFIDWSLTCLQIIKSSNVIRFSTGFLASLGLSRWWYLYVKKLHLDIFWYIFRNYSIAILVILFIYIILNPLKFNYTRDDSK